MEKFSVLYFLFVSLTMLCFAEKVKEPLDAFYKIARKLLETREFLCNLLLSHKNSRLQPKQDRNSAVFGRGKSFQSVHDEVHDMEEKKKGVRGTSLLSSWRSTTEQALQ